MIKIEKTINIKPFFDEKGRIEQLPKKQDKLCAVLAVLAEKFEPGKSYTELDVNAICSEWHTFGDYFLVRRVLVDYGFLHREPDGSRYWRPQE